MLASDSSIGCFPHVSAAALSRFLTLFSSWYPARSARCPLKLRCRPVSLSRLHGARETDCNLPESVRRSALDTRSFFFFFSFFFPSETNQCLLFGSSSRHGRTRLCKESFRSDRPATAHERCDSELPSANEPVCLKKTAAWTRSCRSQPRLSHQGMCRGWRMVDLECSDMVEIAKGRHRLLQLHSTC